MVLDLACKMWGVGFRIEQRINMPSTPAALDSPLTSAECSGIRVQVVGVHFQG